MRYAREVEELMKAFPGRDFRMSAIVRYVCSVRNEHRREKVRRGVHRVVGALIEHERIERDPPGSFGSYAVYRWKP